MTYTSENGYTGVMEKGNFFGIEHWDMSIYKGDKFMYHATLSKPLTKKEFKRQVDEFPEFLKMLMGD